MNKIIKYGIYFGFPECCIKFFDESDILDIIKNHDVANGTGFVPCNSCSNKIRNGEIKLEELVKNRKCKHPFPYQSKRDKNFQLRNKLNKI